LNRPDKFKAPFIPKERIWQEAEKLRATYPAGRKVPVPVLELAEFDLSLDLIPAEGLREELEIDALLIGDLKSILVDRRAFMNPRLEYRLRFSVAHEIGHLVLHRDIYGGMRHATARETSIAVLTENFLSPLRGLDGFMDVYPGLCPGLFSFGLSALCALCVLCS